MKNSHAQHQKQLSLLHPIAPAGLNANIGAIKLDAHCHLQHLKSQVQLDALLKHTESPDAYICCSTHTADWDQVLRLADKYEAIHPALGIHPWFTDDASEPTLQRLEQELAKRPELAVGECGLDKSRQGGDWDRQQHYFKRQLELAIEYKRPCHIHALRALEEVLQIVRSFTSLPPILLHAYNGSLQQTEELKKINSYFSFGSRPNRSPKSRLVIQSIPPERLVIESDAPSIPNSSNEADLNRKYWYSAREQIAKIMHQTPPPVGCVPKNHPLLNFSN